MERDKRKHLTLSCSELAYSSFNNTHMKTPQSFMIGVFCSASEHKKPYKGSPMQFYIGLPLYGGGGEVSKTPSRMTGWGFEERVSTVARARVLAQIHRYGRERLRPRVFQPGGGARVAVGSGAAPARGRYSHDLPRCRHFHTLGMRILYTGMPFCCGEIFPSAFPCVHSGGSSLNRFCYSRGTSL